MKILAIDFETANSSRSSPCSLGLYMHDTGTDTVILEEEMLINPEQDFSTFNIMIHGITPETVCNMPTFHAAYNRLKDILTNDVIVIAHNAAFDMSVLRATCDRYGLTYPLLTYLDTLVLSRICFSDYCSHRLDYLADRLNIPLRCHHNSLEDAKTCFFLYETIRSICDCRTPLEVTKSLNIEPGWLNNYTYSPCGKVTGCITKKTKNRLDEFEKFINETYEVDETHLFHGKIVVFTGTLSSMPRISAAEKVIRAGGIFSDILNKKANFLVTGYRDSYFYNSKEKSNKLIKAEILIQQGAKLEILSEKDFLEII